MLMTKNDITVVIPVRVGSSRVKEKIFLDFNGCTLVEWKINQIKECHPTDLIVVSSNDERVKKIALACGVRYHERSDFLCTGHSATFSEVILGVIEEAVRTPYFAWVTVVVPLMNPIDYNNAFDMFLAEVTKNDKHSLVSVRKRLEYYWYQGKPLNYQADRNHTISQDLTPLYQVTNGLYICSKVRAQQLGYFLDDSPVLFEVNEAASIDIDEIEDYHLALSYNNIM